jgi:hypothetical protein
MLSREEKILAAIEAIIGAGYEGQPGKRGLRVSRAARIEAKCGAVDHESRAGDLDSDRSVQDALDLCAWGAAVQAGENRDVAGVRIYGLRNWPIKWWHLTKQ